MSSLKELCQNSIPQRFEHRDELLSLAGGRSRYTQHPPTTAVVPPSLSDRSAAPVDRLHFITRRTLRFAATSWLTCLVLAGASACAQQADDVRSDKSTTLSLEAARELGRQRSTFRNHSSRDLDAIPKANLAGFSANIGPILARACHQCHGPETQEGSLRIDTLNPDLLNGDDADWWLEVLAVLSNGEMPPPDEAVLADADRASVVEWLSREIQVASTVRRARGVRSSFRRMTRYEFNYALQDLLGLPYDFARDLPPEAHSEDGFENNSAALHMTVSRLQTYRQAARRALQRATVQGERPKVLYWLATMEDAGRIDRAKQAAQVEKVTAEHAGDPETLKRKLEQLENGFRATHSVPYYKDLATVARCRQAGRTRGLGTRSSQSRRGRRRRRR